MNSNKCNIKFETQYAVIFDKIIHISEYTKNIDLYKNQKMYCNKGHELIFVNGKKNKPHFRHKNTEDTGGFPMTEWHAEWQSNFPITEFEFSIMNSKQIKCRRADVLLEKYECVLEIQHSPITELEVNNRKNDYSIHNKKVIWLIDGNSGINVTSLSHSGRVYLEFESELWKYQSFLSYECIYIDIAAKIYKIYPNKVKSHMIDVNPPKSKEEFITALKNGQNIFDNDSVIYQCNLFVKQQGAGNGKSYGIIQNLDFLEFENYTIFIVVVKAHAAKEVLHNEFKCQLDDNDLKHIVIDDEKKIRDKYIINYTNTKTNKKCRIIFATIDSLMYALGDKNHNDLDYFGGMAYSIIDGYTNSGKNGAFSYAQENLYLNKETLIVVDETQDLPLYYTKALVKISRDRYNDLYVVGDKIQTLAHLHNGHKYLLENEFSYIKKTVFAFTNICRRFIHPELVRFVNYMVPYSKYELPEVTPYKKYTGTNHNSPLIIFEGKHISIEDDKDTINTEVEIIMKYYIYEVEINGRKKEDFLFVTLFTQKNPLADAIEIAINAYWESNTTSDKFERHAIFHRSETGSSINTNESKFSTRIVSVCSAKGDGRPVVFVIGLDESSLKHFSGEVGNLIYDSFINVGITRMKETMYFRFVNNNDDVSKKIINYMNDYNLVHKYNIKPDLHIYNSIKFNNILNEQNKKEVFENLHKNIVQLADIEKLDTISNNNPKEDVTKQIIDTSHHNIRYATIFISWCLFIVGNENKNKNAEIKKQIKAIFHSIIQSVIKECSAWKEYNSFLCENSKWDTKIKKIPILNISKSGRDYRNYYDVILQFIKNIKKKLEIYIQNDNMPILCPFECIILYYMMQICQSGLYTDITMMNIYNIIDVYSKSFDHDTYGHDDCGCKHCFPNTNREFDLKNNKKIEDMELFIHTHHEKTKKISDIFDLLNKKYPSLNWLINQSVKYNGRNSDFKMSKKFKMVAYNDDNVIIPYIKPQFNSLNYNEVLLDSIYDTYLIRNVRQYNKKGEEEENYKRFQGKKVITMVITTDRDEPYYIDWVNKENQCLISISENELYILETIQVSLIEKYTNQNKSVYNLFKYYRTSFPDKKPLDFMLFLYSKYSEIQDKELPKEIPNYIIEFLNNIKFLINNAKDAKSKKNILNEYDELDSFMKNINKICEDSINAYLGIQYDDEEDGENT